MSNILKRALIDSVGTAGYIVLVASFMFFLQSSFSDQKDTIITTISALLLLVCSAAITGFLVFGKPAMLYVDGKKREAVLLLGYTLGMLISITFIAFIILIVSF